MTQSGYRLERSKPHVTDAAVIAREIVEAVKAIEVINRQTRNWCRICKANVDGDSPPSIRFEPQSTPSGYTPATPAKLYLKCRICLSNSSVQGAWTGDPDALPLEIVNPQSAIPSAERAIAGRDRVRHSVEGPTQRTAMATSFDHQQPQHHDPGFWRMLRWIGLSASVPQRPSFAFGRMAEIG